MNTIALPPMLRGSRKPSVNIDDPDSRSASFRLCVTGHSSSANPSHRHTSQEASRQSRNVGADTARMLSRRFRSSTLAVTSMNEL